MTSFSAQSVHPGANRWSAARRRSLEGIQQAAERARLSGDQQSIAAAIASHVDESEVKAEAIDRVRRAKPWADISDPLTAAARLHLRALPRSMRTGRWYWLRKVDGRFRLVCSLSWPLRVAQLLVKDVLAHAHVPADHIGDWQGRGPSYHIGRLCDDLRHGGIVLLADVHDCYASVCPDAIYASGLIPSDLVASCFDSRRIRLRAPSDGQRSPTGRTFDRTGQPGLLSGGAASSLLWAGMIDDLPGALPDGARANTYADNIVIVCRSTQECDEAEGALIRYFAEHPAGPFFLKTARADAEGGFDHLGYNIAVGAAGVEIDLKDARLPRLEDRARRSIATVQGHIDETDSDRIANECLSPWPMLSSCSRNALAQEIRQQCNLHNQAFRPTRS